MSCNNLDITKFPDAQYLVTTRGEDGNNTMSENVVPFFLSNSGGPQQQPLGFLRPAVAKALEDYQKQEPDSPFNLNYSTGSSGRQLMSVAFMKTVNNGGNVVRTRRMGIVVEEWKDKNLFRDILLGESIWPWMIFSYRTIGWSKELCPVYVPHGEESSRDPVAFAIERDALPLFGFTNFGCLLTGKTPSR